MEDNELVPVAMQIILHAGDARVLANEAIECAKRAEFEAANQKLVEAHDKIIKAHQSQTKVIQDETRGIEHEPSLLFTHAQDTMMTISSELRLTKVLVEMFEMILTK
ncbi:PTS lactose/cellobiose transporter subunit IIA [uncultured Vagococcus sp.]|uniref:PTS lactose/cellobiose transporter subunit IIA n=1 Tax=uncultured Vagococcus sp. TaxID=189676 RepID=UPI0028CFFE11|nr:PTS lactose/cellobiose transporter subunit IIA [uncultured Vagococcus sp.]